jgi:hypothetical protein
MRKPFIPKWLYKFLGNWGWRRQAKEYGTKDRLKEKPHTDG